MSKCQNGNIFVTLRSRITGVRLLALISMANNEYFNSCPCILGNIKLDYHFLCRLLTGIQNLKIPGPRPSALPEVFWNGLRF
jgi:hypothetical protein